MILSLSIEFKVLFFFNYFTGINVRVARIQLVSLHFHSVCQNASAKGKP